MTREELFEAIGSIDEEQLAASEKRSAAPAPLRRILLVAAIVMGLTTTVFAVPGLREMIFGGATALVMRGEQRVEEQTEEVWIIYSTDLYHIYLELELEEDPPAGFETCYVPVLNDAWQQTVGTMSSGEILLGWDNTQSAGTIFFEQQPGRTYLGPDVSVDGLALPWNAPLTTGMLNLGRITAYEVSMPDYSDGVMSMLGFRAVYWTDGSYIFKLQVPYDFTDRQILAVIDSLTAVETIAPYLFD